MKEKKIRLITAALPYINNVPHLGHIAGSHLPADVFARYSRAKGYDVAFVGGSDENGTPSELAAEKIKIPIKKFLDRLFIEHKKIYDWFEISYDNFSRTSRDVHKKTVQDFFLVLYKKNYIKEGKVKVFYSPKEKRFLPDRYVVGECPICGYKEANADQCENCTSILNSSSLINPRSVISGERVELREVTHLFFKLSELSSEIKKWLDTKKNWRPQVLNLALSWIKNGLEDRSITRDLKHGVKVPLKGFEDKVFYVWFDALIGYISSTIELKKESWKRYWTKDSEIYHFLGKDNIPFHTIFWPGMLIAHGELNLPTKIVGFQYLNFKGKKFSKTKEHGVFCEKLPKSGINPEILRAYLLQILPEVNDSDFSWENFQERVNSDLIGNYGNFFNRVFSFLENKLNMKVIKPNEKSLVKRDKEFLSSINKRVKRISKFLDETELKKAFFELLALSSEGNKYFNDAAPWAEVKKNVKRAKEILYLCVYLSKILSICSAPFLPSTSYKIWISLGLNGKPDEKNIWDSLSERNFCDFDKLKKLDKLFEKISNEDIRRYKEVTSKPTDLKNFF